MVGLIEGQDGIEADAEASDEAKGERRFRLRREQFLLEDAEEIDYYRSLGVDPESRQFPALHRSGLLSGADTTEVQAARDYWQSEWGVDIDPSFHIAFSAVTGGADVRVVPQSEYRTIWRLLNPGQSTIQAYSDKVLFSRLLPTSRQPVTSLVCIDGRYYDGDAAWLPHQSEVIETLARVGRGIIKPTSMDNGRGVDVIEHLGGDRLKLGSRETDLEDLAQRYRKNFMVQEIVRQHETLAEPHPNSLNTLRVVTLRWGGEVHHLLTFARFGVDGRINDNAGTGGLCVGVQRDGTLSDYGINEHGMIATAHPSTGTVFGEMSAVPAYGKVLDFARELHASVPYFDLLSWDIGVDPDAEPVLIECNFRGAVWLYQLAAGQPLFGDLTSELLSSIRPDHGA